MRARAKLMNGEIIVWLQILWRFQCLAEHSTRWERLLERPATGGQEVHDIAAAFFPDKCNTSSPCFLRANCTFLPKDLAVFFGCHFERVYDIRLRDKPELKRMHGCVAVLPSTLGRIASLDSLSFENVCESSFSSIPTEIGQVRWLDLFEIRAEVSGSIPSELCKLQHVQSILFQDTLLTGAVPSEIAQMSRLDVLSLVNSRLIGSLPTELGKLVKLQNLNLRSNNISRTIPSEIMFCSLLKNIYLGENQLTGTVPSGIGKLTQMMEIHFGGNRLQGPMSWHFASRRYIVFGMERNRLEGTIASEIGRLSKLHHFRIEENRFTGEIPKAITSLEKALIIDLSENRLVGTIPEELGRLRKAHFISLSDNTLKGSVPHSTPPADLLAFVLHDNRLKGEIPTSLPKLPSLGMLSLHDNVIHGHLPLLNFTCHPYIPVKPLLTLHKNHLSCKLPKDLVFKYDEDCVDVESWEKPKIFAVPGNRFSLPIPDWLPKEYRDQILFAKENSLSSNIPYLALMLCGFLASLYQSRTLPDSSGDTFKLTLRRIRALQRWFLRYLVVTSAVSFGLLPAYILCGEFYECPESIVLTTAAYLWGSTKGEVLVCLLWCAFVFISHTYVQATFGREHPHLQATSTGRERCVIAVSWCGFLPILIFFGLPGLFFALSKSVPESNLVHIRMGEAYFWCSKFAPVVMYLSDLGLSRFSKTYSRWTGVNYLQLKVFGRTMQWTVMPVLVAFVFHENCVGAWRLLSPLCLKDGHEFDTGFEDVGIDVLRTRDVCHVRWLGFIRDGHCSRSILETLGPLFLKKIVVTSLLQPFQFSLAWVLWRKEFLRWNPLRKLLVDIIAWFQMAVIWGPLVPLLLPSISIAMISNMGTFWFCTRMFGWPHREKVIDFECLHSFLLKLPISSFLVLSVYSVDCRLRGSFVYCVLFVIVTVFQFIAWQRSSRIADTIDIQHMEASIEMAIWTPSK